MTNFEIKITSVANGYVIESVCAGEKNVWIAAGEKQVVEIVDSLMPKR